MANIVNSGRAKIAAKQAANEPLLVTHFVFAFIDGLDPEDEVDLGEVMPDIGDIVHTELVGGQGYVSLDKVVYSTILGPNIGNFTFNWVGLVDEDDVLIAVSYVPPQYKYQTVGLDVGNTLTRNFLMQFNNAQETTGITVEAEAWQIDFLGRLDDIQDDLRMDMSDLFGDGFFIGNGFQIFAVSSTVNARAGVGYVGGLRVVLDADQIITTGVLPNDIYIEAWLDADASRSDVVFEFKSSAAGAPLTNYTDINGVVHYLVKIASVTAGYGVTDLRKNITFSHSIIQDLLERIILRATKESPSFTGNVSHSGAGRFLADFSNVSLSDRFIFQSSTTNVSSGVGVMANGSGAGGYWNAYSGSDPNNATVGQFYSTPEGVTIDSTRSGLGTQNPLFFKIGGAEKARITPEGRFLINTQEDPGVALNIGGTLRASQAQGVSEGSISSNYSSGQIYVQAGANKHPSIGFHSYSVYGGVLKQINGANFGFYGADGVTPANVNAANFLGNIDISYVVGLLSALALKANLASPALTGTPTAPTQSASDNSTAISTTAFVKTAIANLVASSPAALDTLNELAAALGNDPNFATTIATALGLKAPLLSPALTGAPTAPTAVPGTNNTQIATTEFVNNALGSSSKITTIKKASNQGVTNSATLVDATGMSQVLENGALYHVKAFITYNCGPTTGNGIKVTFAGAAINSWMWLANTNSTVNNQDPTANASGGNLQFSKSPNGSSGADEVIQFDGIVTGLGSAFVMRFAQSTAHATTTTLTANTVMIITKL